MQARAPHTAETDIPLSTTTITSSHVKRSSSSSRKRASHDERRSLNGGGDIKSPSVAEISTRTHKHSNGVASGSGSGSGQNGALERRPSATASQRPTSDGTTAADLHAIRAKEAWEMDRLWKGRSMAYGSEGTQLVYAQTIHGDGSLASNASIEGEMHRISAGHGSAHTSFKLQAPFQSQAAPSPAYASVPNGSPVLYASEPHTYPNGFQGYGYNSYPDLPTIPSESDSVDSSPRRPRTNPLPEPPRMSPYTPAPLPPSLSEHDSPHSAEYWAKYAGVTRVPPAQS